MLISNVNKWQKEKQELIKDHFIKEFSFASPERITKIVKIVVSSAVSQATINKQLLDNTMTALERITSQKPIVSKAKKSLTAFKLREGMPIGCRVTLRKKILWNFLFKLIFVNVPRIRDLRGFSLNSFDKNGNYSIGITDFSIFPEVPYDLIFKNQGMQVNIVFTSKEKEENKQFLQLLDFPFKEKRIEKAKREPKFKVRKYTRCFSCGRARSVFRKYLLCRICFRFSIFKGHIPGFKKSSW